MAYFTFEKNKTIDAKGPVGKFFSTDALNEIMKITGAEMGDSIFFSCDKKENVLQLMSSARDKIAKELDLIDETHSLFVGSLIIQCMKLIKIQEK